MSKTLIVLFLTYLITFTVALNLNKLSTDLLIELEESNTANVYIYMKDYINFKEHVHNGKKLMSYTADERAHIIMNTLMKLTEKTQKSIKSTLKTKMNLNYESFWISNSLLIKGAPKASIYAISDRDDVAEIILEEDLKVDPIEEKSLRNLTKEESKADLKKPEFNIEWVKAPSVWEKGFTGQGMVVGVCDTGLVHTHPAIVKSYRGNLGNGRFNHDYNWRGRGNTPTDSHGHGTHCSGTAAGGEDRKIGVAPGAKLIHCAGLGGVPVVGCLQWFLAPTKVDGTSPNPDKRPHVTSHSYRSGATYDREYTALLTAGVHVVNSGGNLGPRCGSVNVNTRTKGQLSVAALRRMSNDVTNFSARGPSTIRGLVRPSVSAPGESVISARASGGYVAMSGTSMSCPNVAGGVALLWSAIPELVRDIEKTNEVLYKSALNQPDNDCGSNGSPNNKFGYGTVNYENAIAYAKFLFKKK